jgi:hypothetical protein
MGIFKKPKVPGLSESQKELERLQLEQLNASDAELARRKDALKRARTGRSLLLGPAGEQGLADTLGG